LADPLVSYSVLEVDHIRLMVETYDNHASDGSAATGKEFRTSVLLRVQMNVVTSLLVATFAGVTRLQFTIKLGCDRPVAQLHPLHRPGSRGRDVDAFGRKQRNPPFGTDRELVNMKIRGSVMD